MISLSVMKSDAGVQGWIAKSASTNGAKVASPGQSPGIDEEERAALKGRNKSGRVPPLQGYFLFHHDSQGVALGWRLTHRWCSHSAIAVFHHF